MTDNSHLGPPHVRVDLRHALAHLQAILARQPLSGSDHRRQLDDARAALVELVEQAARDGVPPA